MIPVPRVRAAAFALLVLPFGAPAMAQPPGPVPASRAARVEVTGGGVFVGGYGLGDSVAELTPNSGTSGFEQFRTANRVRQVAGVIAKIGFVVTPAFVVEGGFRFTRPVYEVRVSGDAEGAPDTTIEETLSQYVVDGSVVWNVTRAAFAGGRAVPFLSGGAGYLRELHEGDALVEEGVEYHAGGGLKWWFGDSRSRFGVRGEGGISIRDGGFDFKDGQRVVPVVSGSLIYTF
jgi:hypothetical protein